MPIAHLEWKRIGSRAFHPTTFLSCCALLWGISFSSSSAVPGTLLLKCFEVFWPNAVTWVTARNPSRLVQVDTVALRSSASACQGKLATPKAWLWIKYWLFCVDITCLEVMYFKDKAQKTNPKWLLSKLLLFAFHFNKTWGFQPSPVEVTGEFARQGVCMTSVSAQLHREEGSQKPQPPQYSVEHFFLPTAFFMLWDPVRDTDTLQGKAILVPSCSHLWFCWRIWKEKLNLLRFSCWSTEPATLKVCCLQTNQLQVLA